MKKYSVLCILVFCSLLMLSGCFAMAFEERLDDNIIIDNQNDDAQHHDDEFDFFDETNQTEKDERSSTILFPHNFISHFEPYAFVIQDYETYSKHLPYDPRYDATFFETKAIVFYFAFEHADGIEHIIRSITVDSGICKISAQRRMPTVVTHLYNPRIIGLTYIIDNHVSDYTVDLHVDYIYVIEPIGLNNQSQIDVFKSRVATNEDAQFDFVIYVNQLMLSEMTFDELIWQIKQFSNLDLYGDIYVSQSGFIICEPVMLNDAIIDDLLLLKGHPLVKAIQFQRMGYTIDG